MRRILKSTSFSSSLYLYYTISAQHPPSTFDDRVINAVSLGTMSDVVPTQSISEVLGPGIVGLFIQGLETGLVLSQISQFLWLGRREGVAINLLVLFVTTVGLSAFASKPISPSDEPLVLGARTCSVQTVIVFLSAWRSYVHNFGQPVSGNPLAVLSRLSSGLTQDRYCPRCTLNGPIPSTQCLYVTFPSLMWFHVFRTISPLFSIVYSHGGTHSGILHMALLFC